jgi:hypothetical protein
MLFPVLVLLIGGMCAACSPQTSAETTALEPYLLTVGDAARGGVGWLWNPPLSARPTTRPPKYASHPMTPYRRIRQGVVHGR